MLSIKRDEKTIEEIERERAALLEQNKKESELTMKKLLSLLLIGAILCATIPVAGYTEDVEDISQFFYIAYAYYDGTELFGEVETPDGDFYIRAVFFLPCEQFFVLTFPISREGTFSFFIAVNCESISISIVDSESNLAPGSGLLYKSAPVKLINR